MSPLRGNNSAQSIGLLAHRIAEDLFAKKVRSALVGRLILHWPSIVGHTIAQATRPARATLPPNKEGTLTILVAPHEALAMRYQTPSILEHLNQFMGYKAFGRLVFRAHPLTDTE